jgi:hypothetical protein
MKFDGESELPFRAEIEAWMATFSNIIKAISLGNKSLAMILQSLKDRKVYLFNRAFQMIQQHPLHRTYQALLSRKPRSAFPMISIL